MKSQTIMDYGLKSEITTNQVICCFSWLLWTIKLPLLYTSFEITSLFSEVIESGSIEEEYCNDCCDNEEKWNKCEFYIHESSIHSIL